MNANTVIVKLSYPVQLADRLLTEVRMRRMVVRDMLDCPVEDVRDVGGELRLMARLCNLVPDELEQMDIQDYGKLQDTLLSFRTGKPVSASGFDSGLSAAGQTGRHERAGSTESDL